MFKISIKNKQGVETHFHCTETEAEALAWHNERKDLLIFGLPSRPELNEMGEPTGVILPAEYEIAIEDITAEIKAEKKSKADKEKRKKDRKDSRKVIDWSKNLTTKQLQEIVKNLVEDLGD